MNKIIPLVILILINAIFAAAEMSFVSINKIKEEEKAKEGNKRAKKVLKIREDSSRFLATIQICITLSGFLASAFAAESFADDIVEKLSSHLAISTSLLENIVLVVVTLILSYITLVFSELVPKKIALAYPEKISYLTVDLISFCSVILYPVIELLTFSTNLVCKVFKIKSSSESKLTEKEIQAIISKGSEEGIIDDSEKDMLLNIFKFDDTTAEQVMTIREKMVAIDTHISEKAMFHVIKECKFSRIPVYKDKLDNVVGVLVVKDLIFEYSKEEKNQKFDIMKIIRPVKIVDADDLIDDVFAEMRKENYSVAIVKRKNRTLGMITMEDAIEEIIGNISDEYN